MDDGTDAKRCQVEGRGALARARGAKGVIAILRAVADRGTGVLMQILYWLRLEHPALTGVEALQEPQLALMGGTGQRGPRGIVLDLAPGDAAPSTVSTGNRYAHPYYWAPFILMGNWL